MPAPLRIPVLVKKQVINLSHNTQQLTASQEERSKNATEPVSLGAVEDREMCGREEMMKYGNSPLDVLQVAS